MKPDSHFDHNADAEFPSTNSTFPHIPHHRNHSDDICTRLCPSVRPSVSLFIFLRDQLQTIGSMSSKQAWVWLYVLVSTILDVARCPSVYLSVKWLNINQTFCRPVHSIMLVSWGHTIIIQFRLEPPQRGVKYTVLENFAILDAIAVYLENCTRQAHGCYRTITESSWIRVSSDDLVTLKGGTQGVIFSGRSCNIWP